MSRKSTTTTPGTVKTTSLWSFKDLNPVPFLPEGWENDAVRLAKQGLKSPFRNKFFESICKMRQSTLKKNLEGILERRGYTPINGDGYLYAKGEIPVLLVAHMDTVHLNPVKHVIYKDEYVISPQGIGGDDRCGIYMVLEVLRKFKCHVVFTEDEEIGCVGATKFSNTTLCKNLKGQISFIVEFDRKNANDCVFYSLDNDEFEDFIESGGYFKTDWGSYSDICEIAPVVGAAAVNLSCGYYNPHTTKEYVNLKEMYKSIEEAEKLIAQHDKKFEYKEMVYNYGKFGLTKNGYVYYQDYDDDYDSYWKNYSGYSSSVTASLPVRDTENEADHMGDDEWVFENGVWHNLYEEKELTTGRIYFSDKWRVTFKEYDWSTHKDVMWEITVSGETFMEAMEEFFEYYPSATFADIKSVENINNSKED